MESAFVVATVVGATELVKRVNDKDHRGATVILVAAIIGGASGFFGVEGLTLTTGIMAGLSAVGVHSVAKQVG